MLQTERVSPALPVKARVASIRMSATVPGIWKGSRSLAIHISSASPLSLQDPHTRMDLILLWIIISAIMD